jgi:hypothetical protein
MGFIKCAVAKGRAFTAPCLVAQIVPSRVDFPLHNEEEIQDEQDGRDGGAVANLLVPPADEKVAEVYAWSSRWVVV